MVTILKFVLIFSFVIPELASAAGIGGISDIFRRAKKIEDAESGNDSRVEQGRENAERIKALLDEYETYNRLCEKQIVYTNYCEIKVQKANELCQMRQTSFCEIKSDAADHNDDLPDAG